MNTQPAIIGKIEGCGCFNAAERDWLLRRLLPPRAWARRQLDRRNGALRAIAAEVAPGATRWSAAAAVVARLSRYAVSAWRDDKHKDICPAAYVGTPAEHCFSAMRAGAGKVPGVRTVYNAFHKSLKNTPLAISNFFCQAQESQPEDQDVSIE